MTRALPVWLALAAGVLMFYCTRHYVEDDSYINFRYLWNWVHGDGIVWNAGERVEGYTSLLMLLLLRVGDALGMSPLLAARLIGIGGLAVTLVTVHRSVRGVPHDVAMVLLLASLPLIVWAQAGLETLLFTALLTMATALVLRALDAQRYPPMVLGLLYGLAVLARPEGLLFAGLGFAWLGIAGMRRDGFHITCRKLLPAALLCTAMVAGQLLWRQHYYGEWMANTYYAKLSSSFSAAQLQMGWRYLLTFLLAPPFLMLYALKVSVLTWRRVNGLLLSSVVLYTVYVVISGGDWMPAQRFFVPLIPLLVWLIARSISHWQDHARAWLMPWIALVFALMPLTKLADGWYPKFPLYLQAIGQHIDRHFPKGSLIAINMAGVIPAVSPEHRYLDMLGLNDRHIARRAVAFTTGSMPGHVKGDGAYVLSRKPDYIILGDAISQQEEPRGIYLSEREMLASPEFARWYVRRQVTVPVAHPDVPAQEIQFQYYERRQR